MIARSLSALVSCASECCVTEKSVNHVVGLGTVETGMPAYVYASSLTCSSKLRGPSPKPVKQEKKKQTVLRSHSVQNLFFRVILLLSVFKNCPEK
ncbi:hypothetical protein TNCV_1077991 [Trichonephila clavipes]|uniref:Uncharacterized protein n=1 Tax=Trichonephila clavipes TaxID=2585209 RepID=A0A8X6V7L2_TRICX|nr:hypothetical protein TNCV_1077991 [Trichonephila clavipes]